MSIPATFTCIDFETANIQKSSACSIGLVRVENGRIAGTYSTYLKPEPFWFHPINVSIHNISEDQCKEAPTFSDIWPEISNWIVDQIIVAHNIDFDRSILIHLLESYNISGQPLDYLCTLYMSRVYLPTLSTHKLSYVYSHIFASQFKHHHALADCYACAEIALEISQGWKAPVFEHMVSALNRDNFDETVEREVPIVYDKLKTELGFDINKQLRGMVFTFSGRYFGFSLDESLHFVINHGGKVCANVTDKTTHLVLEDFNKSNPPSGNGNKHYEEAMKRIQDNNQNISILSSEDFSNMVSRIYPEKPFKFSFAKDRLRGEIFKQDLSAAVPDNPFYAKKVVFTGELSIPRQEAAQKIRLMGADIDSSLSKRTNIVIMGEAPGYRKQQTILKLLESGCEIKIMREDELLDIFQTEAYLFSTDSNK